MKLNNGLKLILSIVVPLGVGALSSFFTSGGVETWFPTIKKPSWNPPNYLFGPVWTVLYIMMGIAFYLVWKSKTYPHRKDKAYTFFTIQLVLNFFWSIIFFDRHQIGWALVDIVVLWFFILLTIFAFARISKTAAWLLVPYISWVTFATILNYTIWKLNS